MLKVESEILGIKFPNRTKGAVYLKIPLKEQYLLFTIISDILSSEEKLESFIQENDLKSTDLTRDFANYPFWYKKFVDKYNDSIYSLTVEEAENAIAILKRNNKEINWKNLQSITGRCLEARKRLDIKKLLRGI